MFEDFLLLSVTPSDYEPPGFVASEHDGFIFEKDSENIKVGDVATVSSYVKDF